VDRQNQAASESSSSQGTGINQSSGASAALSLHEAAEQLWQLARTCEAEKAEVRQQFEEEESRASRRHAIQHQHRGQNYSKQELSRRLWDLVKAAEKFTKRERKDDDVLEQQNDGEAHDGAPLVDPTFSSAQQDGSGQQRRKGVFEDIGVSQQAAWCGTFTGT
jgi:hypothetical protein